MKWAEISVTTASQSEEAVANILHETGATGVVIEDAQLIERGSSMANGETADMPQKNNSDEGIVLKAYLPLNRDLTHVVESVRTKVSRLTAYGLDIGAGKVTVHDVDSRDWENEWKKYYKPIRISERLIVKPTWEKVESRTDDEIIIELDPGMAFGTGTHASTVLSLLAMEKIMRGDERVIDIGCGSGILSIAAAKFGASHVTAVDVDDVAVSATRQNVALNGVQSRVDVRNNDLVQGMTVVADLAVANILAEVIVSFVPDVATVLAPGGMYITSGIIEKKETLVYEALSQHFDIKDTLRQDGWVAIIAQKR